MCLPMDGAWLFFSRVDFLAACLLSRHYASNLFSQSSFHLAFSLSPTGPRSPISVVTSSSSSCGTLACNFLKLVQKFSTELGHPLMSYTRSLSNLMSTFLNSHRHFFW